MMFRFIGAHEYGESDEVFVKSDRVIAIEPNPFKKINGGSPWFERFESRIVLDLHDGHNRYYYSTEKTWVLAARLNRYCVNT